jgi:hypothetical protein
MVQRLEMAARLLNLPLIGIAFLDHRLGKPCADSSRR